MKPAQTPNPEEQLIGLHTKSHPPKKATPIMQAAHTTPSRHPRDPYPSIPSDLAPHGHVYRLPNSTQSAPSNGRTSSLPGKSGTTCSLQAKPPRSRLDGRWFRHCWDGTVGVASVDYSTCTDEGGWTELVAFSPSFGTARASRS
ncbi:hypothetical protein CKAH01_07274 [Colletotrichum kahawae]|uniref:Uncharacterized protein n=1 Tax=Colletotrichum kahawae TaxID=34407 RepID=A0AAE0D1S9_COLKA|nr:hypothetical protein CKAH01_07274 [Colletotrichum kahawae]